MVESNPGFLPLYDRVLIRRAAATTVSKGGIDLSMTAQEKPFEGQIVAVGEGRRGPGGVQPLTVEVGQTVVFSKFAGFPIKINDEELLCMKEDEIFGIRVMVTEAEASAP